ncbi:MULTISPECIES: hypothetical protein [Nocardia]|uniref:Secreted protein n=1 Tax=Nocardia sputorum TaxID=2984338 RepID=A0ABM8D2A6_9NOCA|nr:hypothetical protein [Nocardia sputorum]BDT95252.1 hypothetical protein IFM12275_52280 [Nocardia sputorum]BDU01490.1 hypothetical protein IFM12276_45180 [Nocardia sputorum]
MATFLITLAVLVVFATVIARGTASAGSSNVIDRDAERLHSELTAMLGRNTHHR